MWLAYVDESYNDTYYYVAALLVRDVLVNETQSALRDVVEQAADDFGIEEEAELHGYELFHGSADFLPMHEMPRARISIYRKVYEVLVEAEAWLILRGVHRPGLQARYGGRADHPHSIAMTHLIEQIDEFCTSPRGLGEPALIVADEHKETEAALLRDLITYQERGTWGYLARRIMNVVDTIHFVASRNNRLVQAADMAAFLTVRDITHAETDRRSASAIRGLQEIIEPRIWRRWCWHPRQP